MYPELDLYSTDPATECHNGRFRSSDLDRDLYDLSCPTCEIYRAALARNPRWWMCNCRELRALMDGIEKKKVFSGDFWPDGEGISGFRVSISYTALLSSKQAPILYARV